jgi:hypothetical protein
MIIRLSRLGTETHTAPDQLPGPRAQSDPSAVYRSLLLTATLNEEWEIHSMPCHTLRVRGTNPVR